MPRLLEVLQTNENYKEALRPVFEIAHLYRREGKAYGEKTVLAIAAPGDPLGVKGILETTLARLAIPLDLAPVSLPFLEAGTAAEVRMRCGRVSAAVSGWSTCASICEPRRTESRLSRAPGPTCHYLTTPSALAR